MAQLAQLDWQAPGRALAEARGKFGAWLAAQPLPVEAAVVTLMGGAQGAFLGGVMGSLTKDAAQMGQNNPEIAKQMSTLAGGPMVQARNFAVLTGVNAGLSLVVKKLRGGKDDWQTAAVAGFGSGAAFSLAGGVASPNPLQTAFSTGVMFALLQAAFFQLGGKFGGGAAKAEEGQYAKAAYLLQGLGLQKYTRNLRGPRLTDPTIMLWTEMALRDARIPAGPRLLILHHIDSYRNLLKPGMPLPVLPSPPVQPSAAAAAAITSVAGQAASTHSGRQTPGKKSCCQ